MKTRKNKLTSYLKLGILLFGISLLLWNCEQDQNINLNNSQNEFSIPSIVQTKKLFQQKIFSKKLHSKSEKNLEILWRNSIPKEFKENINILYTPINFNSTKRFKSLIASVKKDNQIQSYVLTLFYDKISNNKQFSGHIFKHDSKGNFVEAYQYHKGNHIKTFKESKNNNKIASRGGGCTTSIFEIVALAMSGWDPGTVLDCVEVGGNNGGNGSTSSTFDDWSTPSSNIKNPIGWSLGSNNNLGSGSGGDFGDPNNGGSSNNNSNGEELNLDGVEPWWAEDDKIINQLTGKADCAFNKLLSSGASNFHNMITDLFIEFGNNNIGGRDLTFKMSNNLPNNIGGKTQVDSNGDYHILINENLMNTLSSIEVASILVHEMAHAFLGKHYNDSNASFSELYEKYINDTGIQNYSHDIMKDQFINRMAIAIRNYDNTIFSSFEDYKILASRGVFELSSTQKQNLINVINKARQNDKNCS